MAFKVLTKEEAKRAVLTKDKPKTERQKELERRASIAREARRAGEAAAGTRITPEQEKKFAPITRDAELDRALRGEITPKEETRLRETGITTVGEGVTRRATDAELILADKIRAGTAGQADYDRAGVSMPTALGGTGRVAAEVAALSPEEQERIVQEDRRKQLKEETWKESFKRQAKESWELPFYDIRSLKATAVLGTTLVGLLTFGYGTGILGTGVGAGGASTIFGGGFSTAIPSTYAGVGIIQTVVHSAIFKAAVAYAGVDAMVVWLGADNRISTSSYYSNLVKDAFNDGEKTKGEALARMDELETTVKQSKDFIDWSTMLNPLLRPFRTMFMGNADDAEKNMADNRNFIETTPETKSAMFERIREEEKAAGITESEMFERIREEKREDKKKEQEQFIQNQELIEEGRKASEERFKEAQDERDADKEAWAKESAQFYEALRKRNAGQPLTQEEKDLLYSWGISPETSMKDYDAYAPSNLNFGLL